jgi:glycosyltransferase involved in cell wall biosynthesis
MRIGIDSHQLGRRQTGNERVMRNLIEALGRVTNHEFVLYFTDQDTASSWSARYGSRFLCKVLPARSAFVRVPLLLPRAAHIDKLDALLCHVVAPPVCPCTVVTIIHDISFRRYPRFFPLYERVFMNAAIPQSMKWSDALITVSKFTSNEIQAVYGIPKSKMFVARNGVDAAFLRPDLRNMVSDSPYFLAVGNVQPRKNLGTLLKAFAALVKKRPGVEERLVIIGQPTYAANQIMSTASELVSTKRVEFTGYVEDAELVNYMAAASAFLYPSIYEGFGLPPLEAMALGTPVAVADIPVMKEVVGNAGLRVPPMNSDKWAESLERLIDEPHTRETLAEKGLARASLFSWDAMALKVTDAIEATVAKEGASASSPGP